MKFNHIFLSVALSAALMGGFTSCDDFLAEDPYAFVDPDQVGNDNAAVNLWVTGVYSKWANDMFRWQDFPRVLEMDCDYTSGPDWAFSNLGAGNFQGDEVTDAVWKGCYSLINRANVALNYVNQITGADEKVKANAIGELKFNKAFAYFMLTKAYGDIPMFDVAISEGASYEQPRRPIAEVYAEIIRLLEEAIPVMYKNTDADFQEGHVAQGAAAGLLAKVYATMASGSMTAGEEMIVKTGASYEFNNGEKVLVLPTSKTFKKTQVAGYESFDTKDCYTKAAQYAKDVMDGKYGSYDLLPYDELWKRSNYNKTEHMFMLQTLNNDEEYGNTIHRWFSGTENAQGLIQQGQWIGNRYHWYTLFDSKDYRITKGVKHRFRYSYQASDNYGFYYPNTPEYKLMATGYDENGNKVADPVAPYNDGVQYTFNVSSSTLAYSTKYSDVTDPTVERSDAYWPFLRYADIVLIYAEAMCELGSGVDSEAIKALNAIRARSNANPAVTSGNGAIDSKVALRSAIFEERAKELALEGDRRWDLIRWGLYLDVMNSIGGTNEDGTKTNYDEASVNKHRETKHLLFPIPSAEISTNDAIDSNNPGWS